MALAMEGPRGEGVWGAPVFGKLSLWWGRKEKIGLGSPVQLRELKFEKLGSSAL